ncbi:hypothetical protein SAMN05216516_102198 [Izhakiella capsodis]|uniref:Uncharacterized protein n=1 Tax=Izhakiella capsodis TaxID=1367852 RepID=A0A1I4W0N7_9GAMM|nr:hypothetical protein SAMN05216516_102198 [Izhakiella capsodis]
MFFHDDESGQTLIGEAALSLALSDKDISVDTLLAQLRLFAENEISDLRLIQISDATHWLRCFRQPGQRNPPALYWLAGNDDDGEGKHAGDVVRLRPENDDDR